MAKEGRSALRTIGGIVVALAVAGGFYLFQVVSAKSGAPEVGECVSVTDSSDGPELDAVDCDDADASYEVMAEGADCDPVEVSYTVTVRSSDAVELCLDINAASGDCFAISDVLTEPFDKVACEDNTGDPNVIRIAQVSETTGIECKGQQNPVVNETRGTSVCVAPNN